MKKINVKRVFGCMMVTVMMLATVACGNGNSNGNTVNSGTETEKEKEENTPAVVTPNATYDLLDGQKRTKEEYDKMFNYWVEGFDQSITANVKAEGKLLFIDCDDDGKMTDKDVTNLSILDEIGAGFYQIELDFSKINEADLPASEDMIHIEGIWMHNPNSDDKSDYRLYVEKVTKL